MRLNRFLHSMCAIALLAACASPAMALQASGTDLVNTQRVLSIDRSSEPAGYMQNLNSIAPSAFLVAPRLAGERAQASRHLQLRPSATGHLTITSFARPEVRGGQLGQM